MKTSTTVIIQIYILNPLRIFENSEVSGNNTNRDKFIKQLE